MPISLRPDQGDVPQLGDPAFDALLARTLRPEEAVASLRPMVEGFAAWYAAPVYSAPAVEASAMAAFRALAAAGRGSAAEDGGPAAGRPGRWVWPRPVRIRLGVAAAAVALAAASAAAAYTGELPAPMQRVAHIVIGAPPAAQGVPRPGPGHPAVPPIPGNARLVHPGNPAASHPAHPQHGKPSTAATPPSHHGKPSWAASPRGKPAG